MRTQAPEPVTPHAADSSLRFAAQRRLVVGSRNRLLGALALLGVALVGCILLFRSSTNGQAKDPGDANPPFQHWPKPDLALFLSGQSIGYLQPCGCSSPQYGGLARRFNVVKSLKDKGWPVVAVDLGDVSEPQSLQSLIRYKTTMKALDLIGYAAVGLGKNEYLMPLDQALGNHSLNFPSPRVVATNLNQVEPNQFWHEHNVRPFDVASIGEFRVGVLGVTGPSVAKAVLEKLADHPLRKDVTFGDQLKAAGGRLEELKGKVNVTVVLFQGDKSEAVNFVADAWKLYKAGKSPLVHAVLYLDKDAPSVPDKIDGIPTLIITLGEKGKHVGVLGLFKKDKHTELRYQLITVGPEYEPKEGDEKINPVAALMQQYADELKKEDYLKKFKPFRKMHPMQAVEPKAFYVGSEACKKCHEDEYAIWKKSAHAHAYQTLVDAKMPSGRQYDPECIKCHTVGFEYRDGYFDPSPKLNPKDPAELDAINKHNTKLLNVGCENCHGPGSAHVLKSEDKKIHKLINPFRPTDEELSPATSDADKTAMFKRRWNLMSWACMKCHDEENDVHWSDAGGFDAKWIKSGVIHNTPGGRGDTAMKNAALRASKEARKAP